ncbi:MULTISPECIES: glycosyltransferase [Brevibacterium]|uniref:D-inositol 3-phosphate glycosyltransferase n=1 Tax=Brevibacterium luteolum TaxID=199591 RepID=A0A2N6PIQ6_9MICO|nr:MULTISPECIES: glycosyltransferase [Brevibacterium]PMB98537.1 hypothetical protein CJ198_04150 [Brevibacterium luteolum]
MRVAVVGPARMPIAPPFGGGLEVFCDRLTAGLREAGVQVDLYASAGSRGHRQEFELPGIDWTGHEHIARDDAYPPGAQDIEHTAYRQLFERLQDGPYDLIHNNSVSPAFFSGASGRVPMLTTLHVPPGAPLDEAISRAGSSAGSFAAVSAFTAGQWQLPEPATVVHNGVDTRTFAAGPGGDHAVWFGRITPEKGLHLAIDACRAAGVPLRIIGRCAEPRYFTTEIEPRLGDDALWVGHLDDAQIAAEVGAAAVTVVTPCWDEPFGLVTIESLSCGTPVAAFARGGIPEVLADAPELLARPGDVDDLAAAIGRARRFDRARARRMAVTRFDCRHMVAAYLRLYSEVIGTGRVAAELIS